MTSQLLTANDTSAQGSSSQGWLQRVANIALASDTSTRAAAQNLAIRIGLAAVMLPHGLQKTFAMFGGYGWSGTMGFFTENMGIPAPVAAAVILLEFLGPIALLAGIGVRFVALGFVGIMLGAIVQVHGAHGFFMNWFGNQAGEGFEYHLLVIALAVAAIIGGAGRWSADQLISNKLGK